jgi:hypothetical protein
MLRKHTGTTKDIHGCEFCYTCFTSVNGDDIEKTYIDDVFGMKTETLEDLKEAMSNK